RNIRAEHERLPEEPWVQKPGALYELDHARMREYVEVPPRVAHRLVYVFLLPPFEHVILPRGHEGLELERPPVAREVGQEESPAGPQPEVYLPEERELLRVWYEVHDEERGRAVERLLEHVVNGALDELDPVPQPARLHLR